MLKAPFPWFGGKSRVAPVVWQAFGEIPNYVEPFFGSGAVLLNRPDYDPLRHTETVNDADCYLANLYRAIQSDPEQVASYADSPVNEADLHARHQWLVNQIEFREKLKSDPDYYDVKIAGWWVWGQCCWIGSGWCSDPSLSSRGNPRDPEKGTYRQRPDLSGKGVLRQLPHLGDSGQGLHRKRPHLGNLGRGIHRKRLHLGDSGIMDYFEALQSRLRRVRVCCGDWSRILGPSVTFKHGLTGIFLDPPYSREIRTNELYAVESDVSIQVKEWAISSGDNPLLRIAICGYAEEFADMPSEWTCFRWKAPGGYGSQGQGKGRQNAGQEVIWFSKHCLIGKQKQLSLLEAAHA